MIIQPPHRLINRVQDVLFTVLMVCIAVIGIIATLYLISEFIIYSTT